jgi:Methyltransferase domain
MINMNMFRKNFKVAKKVLKDPLFVETALLSQAEVAKKTSRTEIINYLLTLTKGEHYLEIGVRNPSDNFEKIICKNKFSVDPGLEFKSNPVDFKLTSDDFFDQLENGKLEKLNASIQFDVIFIDGLHLSNQVEKDILNSIRHITDDGFIVLHDCNPPSEFHQRENFDFKNSPAGSFWNGTTWKAFYKYRHQQNLYSACFDTDWGVGVISKKKFPLFNFLPEKVKNEFYEYGMLEQNRKEFLNLQIFSIWEKEMNSIKHKEKL